MTTRPTLSVPTPCHENWQTMTPATQGRHCAACNKVVVDFTRMMDTEILAYLGQSTGKSCGRFRQEQLNRPLVVAPASGATWHGRWMALVTLLGLGAGIAPVAQAQQATPIRVQRTITLGMVAEQPSVLPVPLTSPPQVVRSVVVDSATYEPLPGVTVVLVNTTVGVSTNAQGEFELLLPETLRQSNSVDLNISSVGYESRQVQLDPHFTNRQSIELAPSTRMLGEMIIVGGYETRPWYTPRSLWWRITRPFRQH